MRDNFWHRIAHWRGSIRGRVETWRTRSGRVMVGFRCGECGSLEDIRPAFLPLTKPRLSFGRTRRNPKSAIANPKSKHV